MVAQLVRVLAETIEYAGQLLPRRLVAGPPCRPQMARITRMTLSGSFLSAPRQRRNHAWGEVEFSNYALDCQPVLREGI